MFIVIPEYGNRNLTNRLLEGVPDSLRSSVYVGNDAYQEDQPPLPQKVHEIKWDTNVGFAGNVNRTVACVSSTRRKRETLLIVNTDVQIGEDALELLDTAVQLRFPHKKKFAILGPAIIVPDKYVAHEKRHLQMFNQKLYEKLPTKLEYLKMTMVSGCCMAMVHWLWEKLGGFDAESFKYFYEDDDLCLRARMAGYRSFVVLDATVVHDVGATHKRSKEAIKQMLASRATFKRKWPMVKWNTTGSYLR